MNEANDTSDLWHLFDVLCNDQLSAEDLARLQAGLRDNPEAQQAYLAYLDMHLGLKHVVATESGTATVIGGVSNKGAMAPVKRKSRFSAGPALAASLLVVAGVIGLALFVTHKSRPTPQITAKVLNVSGSVRVHQPDGIARIATVGMEVSTGERVETNGPGALAVLGYLDGTRLALVNDSLMTCVVDQRKSMLLHHGIVSAQVTPQPTGHPMLLVTPGARIQVLGTRFALAATTDRTELNVSEGRVQLTRVSDGRVIEVAQGQGVVTNGETELTVRESGRPRETWNADFENGVPEGWVGTFTKSDLPLGSLGGIRAVREEGTGQIVYIIACREEWVEGLFSVHEDSHLHITMKMEKPDWLNVFLSTRGSDATNPTWALHNFNEVPFWPPKRGQWRTVTIPLSKFRRKRDGEFRNEPPLVGEVAYTVNISATEPDRGLVVDRIWVTRGGPGEVEAKTLR
jgi:hypothetical protein